MTSGNKERFNQLGLPPMELAESTANSRNNKTMLRCLLPTLQKVIIMLLITIFGFGTYILLLKMLGNCDSPGNTQIILIKEQNEEAPNLLNIIRLLNTTSENEIIRKKRATDSTHNDPLDYDDFNSLNDEQLQRARQTIMEYDVLCNEEEKQGICKDLVTKLKAITSNNGLIDTSGENFNQIDSDHKTIAADRREASPIVLLDKIKEIENIGEPGQLHSQPALSNCILPLLKNYPSKKGGILDPINEYFTYAENEHDQRSQNRFYSPAEHTSHVRNTKGPRRKIHRQDFDILLNFFKPITFAPEPEHTKYITREVSCPDDTKSCLNGDACVEKKQWCNGYVDCADVSDEARCNCKSRVDKSRLCDGYFDCPFGEDEMGCHGCSDDTFSCEDKNAPTTCFTKEQRCNNVVECPNHKDEVECNMLAPSLLRKPILAISNIEGFLHRNFKGEWYAVCKNPYMWAHDVCRSETGLIIRPPLIEILPIDPMLKINYINSDHGGLLQTTDRCINSSAIYVTCLDMVCGTRVKSTSQMLRENIAIENHLFGRNKRFPQSNRPYPLMSYGNRWKRNTNGNSRTNHKMKFETPKTEAVFDKMRNKRTESRVVGGRPSQPAAWPWIVAVYRNGIFHCGGVVITQSWVISAAHCVHKFWGYYYEVQVGMLRRFSFSPQEQSYKVTHVIVNQHYSQRDMKNDLSLLKVEPHIQFSRWVRPICLPTPDTAGQDWLWGPPAGTICTAVGWGATTEHGPDPDHLREVELPIWDKCIHNEDRAGKEICAGFLKGGKDACQGDSGGPLLCKNPLNSQQWYLVGIVSHGEGCGREGEPGVYTRVSLFVRWIRHHISSSSLPMIQPIQECPGFKCESGIPKCLPNTRKCDKIVDCLDGEDEVNCEFTKTVTTFTENSIFPKSDVIEETLTAKAAKFGLNKEFIAKENAESIDGEKTIVSTTPYSISMNEDKGNTDFEQASTTENFIINSTEEINFENVTADFATTTSHDFETRADSEALAVIFDTESFESRSSLIEKISEETTEKDFNHSSDNEQLLRQLWNNTSTAFTQNDSMEITTHKIFDENPTTIHSSLDGEKEVREKENSNSTIISLLPVIHFNVSDQITEESVPTKTGKSTSNKTHVDGSIIKQLPNLDDKSMLLKRLEDIVSSELQPATVRRKHLIPNEFLCRRIYQIIPFHHRCNRVADCEDGTDELDCSCTDYLTTFDKNLICDGFFDCADGHDESSCFFCSENQFLCKHSQVCLPLQKVCDGRPHCPQGEDEMDCFALTNGKEIYINDLDERPAVNLEGYLTKKHLNKWHVVCDDKLNLEQQDLAATRICRYLGFGAANKFYVKYININEDEIATRSIRTKRNTMKKVAIHFAYRHHNEANNTEEVVIKDAQVIKEQCIPNITKTCKSLYIFCDHSLFNNFVDSDNILLRKRQSVNNQIWPWAAKIFVEGEYRCVGVLVNLSWVVVSETCLWDSTLTHHFITVVLGSHRTLDSISGMYEQSYQVDMKKDIYRSRVVLLHLKTPAHYSNFVKPMVVSSSFTYLDTNSTCVAVGQDNNNKTISITLEETNANCHPSNRCFIRKTRESICPLNTHLDRPWAGIISCHTTQGWFPAASFVDSRGECELGDLINATSIDNLKNEISHLHTLTRAKSLSSLEDIGDNDNCEGIRCGRGRCIPLNNLCDGVRSCEDANDESDSACDKKISICSTDPYHTGCECSVGQMKCRNGICLPKELFRDGKDDCGDKTDEPGESTCSLYLARVMPSRLCDGILHCQDRSDEDPMFCKCFAKNSFKCGTSMNEYHCVAPDMVCDGVRDCPNGDDENTCIGLNSMPGTIYSRGTGQVIMRSHGVWYTKCYPTKNHTKSELEAICVDLGFINGHAKQLHDNETFLVHKHNNLIKDSFNNIILNNNTKIKMRNTNKPIAEAIFDDQKENCHPLFIECL